MGSSKKIRIGLVGSRFFAELLHIPSIKSHDGAVLHSICSRDKENAEKVAEKYSFEQHAGGRSSRHE